MATKILLNEVRSNLKGIFLSAIEAVSPKQIIKDKVKLKDGALFIENKRFSIGKKIYLVGFGKAVMNMAIELEKILGNHLIKGIVSVPEISKDLIWTFDKTSSFPNQKTTVLEFREGAVNNQPDDRSLNTTHDIIDLVESLTETDTLIVLVSGGGSALLYMPRPTIDSEDKMRLCKELQNAGADITEVNILRRKLSMVKGGGLARMAYPASIISLIISDIIDDPIDLIASGPTVYNPKLPEEVIAVLRKYGLFKSVESDLKYLITSTETFNDAPLLNSEKKFKHVNNIILANNMTAVEGARVEALRRKLVPIILQNNIKGHVHDVSLAYVNLANLICLTLNKTLSMEDFLTNVNKSDIISLTAEKVKEIYSMIENVNGGGVVLIAAGEPTVKVTGTGKGGRNQELALYFSLDWLAKVKSNPLLAAYDVIIFSGGTDGQDGPTDAAGAFGYPAFAPVVYQLLEILKSLRVQEITAFQSKKEDNTGNEVVHQDPCKRYMFSDYLTSKSIKLTDQESNKIAKEIDDIESLDINEYEKKYKTELMIMEVERIIPENALAENNSYNFFSRYKKGENIVKTGFTGTNVMDLHFIYIKKRDCTCEMHQKEGDVTVTNLDDHDLHINPETIKRHKSLRMRAFFKKDEPSDKSLARKIEIEKLNIKIIDENLRDPCCNKLRKTPSD
ncbi:PREDICTED: glycerate kinase-like [Polistes canadensis]|uniref:glycerate kinase-like n=1 Tax=Polistes canadensis TaxID=91411 RepID=UPI000718AC84|nr:PREDICTED: glycerate kinase-like [Polistes canadensis]